MLFVEKTLLLIHSLAPSLKKPFPVYHLSFPEKRSWALGFRRWEVFIVHCSLFIVHWKNSFTLSLLHSFTKKNISRLPCFVYRKTESGAE